MNKMSLVLTPGFVTSSNLVFTSVRVSIFLLSQEPETGNSYKLIFSILSVFAEWVNSARVYYSKPNPHPNKHPALALIH